MQEIVINRRFGGFGLSHKAVMRYAKLKGIKLYPYLDEITKKVWIKYHKDKISIDKIAEGNFGIIHYSTKKPTSERLVNANYFSERDIKRDDQILIKVVREMGKKANGKYANLKVVKIPDGINYEIDEYDGIESIHEVHNTWR